MARSRKRREVKDIDDSRMSLGDHLEELRSCLIRSLVALVVACLLCIWPAKYLLELIARPVIIVLQKHGQPASFLQTSPTEVLMIYVKVVITAGLIVAAPYILFQLWTFVAAGLYRREKEWVYRLIPASVGLFLTGVAFMYTLVLLVSLNFLVGLGEWIPLPSSTPTAFERLLINMPKDGTAATQPAVAEIPPIPVFESDPPDAPAGRLWFNLQDNKLKLRGPVGDETYSVQLMRDDVRPMVTTHFKIGDYLSFVLIMTIAFGLAFQMPLVVVFLAGTGLVSVAAMRRSRKFVILIVVFIAGMLAPPDFLSHLMLSGPMVLLFEIGLLFAARKEKAMAAAAGSGAAAADEPESALDRPVPRNPERRRGRAPRRRPPDEDDDAGP